MSKGSQIVPVRFPAEQLEAMDTYIAMSQDTRKGDPWDRGSFIRQAVREKLDHLRRSRRPRRTSQDSGRGGVTPSTDAMPTLAQPPSAASQGVSGGCPPAAVAEPTLPVTTAEQC